MTDTNQKNNQWTTHIRIEPKGFHVLRFDPDGDCYIGKITFESLGKSLKVYSFPQPMLMDDVIKVDNFS